MTIICTDIGFSNIIAGVLASFVFLICNYIYYWAKWRIYSSKFIGVWEQYEFNNGKIFSICTDDKISGTLIKRCFINPKIIIASTVTYEAGGYRKWKAKYELISSNYCTGEYQYLPDEHKQQWGTHELWTQQKNDGMYILLSVQDGGSRDFTKSGQLLKKVIRKINLVQYNRINNKIISG